ncbi:MAG TPA: DUF1629 domain-containing protein [Cellvibrio sp.]|nr:DUF1629 domain-containing protein [Cellvibrio sp.]
MTNLILCPDTNVSPDITLTGNSSCFEMIWENGCVLDPAEEDFSRLEFVCEDLPLGYIPDYAVSDLGCSIVSARLRQLLEESGIDNIQYFAASICERPGAEPKPGYFAANIIGLVDCIDTTRSEMRSTLDEDDGQLRIFRIRKLVLKEVNSNSHLYRVNRFSRLILIEERFKEIFAGAGIQGVRLILPERWDGYNGEI